MKNTAMRKVVLAALVGSMAMSTANADSVEGNGGSTEATQILNNAELVQQSAQIVQELQMLRQLFMAQMQAQNAYLARQEQQQANDRSTMDTNSCRTQKEMVQ